MSEQQKWLRISSLYEALKEHGASFTTYQHLRVLEDNGKLTLPRLNNKRGDRRVTKEMINNIVKAFTPGGEGEWFYEDYQNSN